LPCSASARRFSAVSPRRSPVRSSPEVHGGQPLFAGTTVPIRRLLEHLRAGGDITGFLDVHPAVAPDTAREVLGYALELLIQRERVPAAPKQGSLLPRTDRTGVIVNAADLTADLVVHRRVLCPACRAMTFQRWPEGWDSHSEHRCAGIMALDPVARKREFKQRFGHLFR